MPSITEQIISNEYHDYIVPYDSIQVLSQFSEYGVQLLDSHYMLLHARGDYPDFPFLDNTFLPDTYTLQPSLYVPQSTVSLENSGIINVQIQPNLGLSGKGILMGFLDSGIDYTHPAFLDSVGRTRIVGIWDQTIQDGASSATFQYGTEYTQEQINESLTQSPDEATVKSRDETGHGTYLAGVAAGSPNPEAEFTGVAYDADICVVKLKQAKQYLRDYFFASPNAIVYQENDLMTAINYLRIIAQQRRQTLVICIGLGTNRGDHAGNSPLSRMITAYSYSSYTNFILAGGNEGGRAHHFSSVADSATAYPEILVPDQTLGFTAELWGPPAQSLSIGFQTPLGTQIAPIPARIGNMEEINFLLETTKITVSYFLVTETGGDQLIQMRFENPTPGNWQIKVVNGNNLMRPYHIWLPIAGLSDKDIRFLAPDPNTTLTVPSDSSGGITTSTYNAYNQSLYIHSSRGFTRKEQIKPDIASPGVDITGPLPNKRYTNNTGSSSAAAILAGSAALMQQWSERPGLNRRLNSANVLSYFIRGATRDNNISYPNREWGYGKLNVYNIFSSFMS